MTVILEIPWLRTSVPFGGALQDANFLNDRIDDEKAKKKLA